MSLVQNASSITLNHSIVFWTYIAGSVATATALVFLSKKLSGRSTHKNGLPLPPGPPATWFWENPMPKEDVARGLAALVKRYGPVVSFRRGSNVTVVIGRMDAATDIMEKEGGALVDRPRMVAADEILSEGMRLVLTPSGERFRRLRRAAHTHLQPKAAETYEEIQAETAKGVILDILSDPKNHIKHGERYAASVILRITYGKTSPTRNDDLEVIRIHKALEHFQTSLQSGRYLVDFIPWLKYVPGYGRELKQFRHEESSLYQDQMNRVRRNMETNSATPSFAKTLLEHIGDHLLSDDEMAYLAGTLFGAGSDTTASGITAMIMAAALHPDAQARVQEELDYVVGDRVPTFGDREMLPQLEAFILETLRWRPVNPLGIAHRATKDIIWKGYCIPAGATVIGSHWTISRDPVVFPDPETFNPGRWLTDEGHIRTDMHFYTFGFGRRVCPGQYVAIRSLYINLALLLWSFRIVQRPGVPIDIHASNLPDLIVFHAKPFEVDFVPRVEEGRLRELMA